MTTKTPSPQGSKLSSPKNPVADPVLLDFLEQESAPTAPDLRLGIVKLALTQIAHWRGHDRLSLVFAHGDEHAIKAIVLAASHLREDAVGALLIDDEPDYKRALRLLGTITTEPQVNEYQTQRSPITDETLLRIIEVAGDVLDWDGGEPEYQTYVTPAWPVLADEYEWEREGGDDPWNRTRRADRFDDRPSGPATGRELLAMEREERQFSKGERSRKL